MGKPTDPIKTVPPYKDGPLPPPSWTAPLAKRKPVTIGTVDRDGGFRPADGTMAAVLADDADDLIAPSRRRR